MRANLVVVVLGLAAVWPSVGRAQDYSKYTQLETPFAYVYMDHDGVAIRVEKNWSCRNAYWASTAEPLILDKAGFDKFKSNHESWGDASSWTCMVQAGPVTFSRDILRAQEALNAAQVKPAGAPFVPETGRYNWEMLEFARCGLRVDVENARSLYKADFLFLLATLLQAGIPEARIQKETDALLGELVPIAQLRPLAKPDTACGERTKTVYDLVACRFASRDALLTEAGAAYADFTAKVEGLKGREVISQSEQQEALATAARVKASLTRENRETQGL